MRMERVSFFLSVPSVLCVGSSRSSTDQSRIGRVRRRSSPKLARAPSVVPWIRGSTSRRGGREGEGTTVAGRTAPVEPHSLRWSCYPHRPVDHSSDKHTLQRRWIPSKWEMDRGCSSSGTQGTNRRARLRWALRMLSGPEKALPSACLQRRRWNQFALLAPLFSGCSQQPQIAVEEWVGKTSKDSLTRADHLARDSRGSARPGLAQTNQKRSST
jgi:hypothetical protein